MLARKQYRGPRVRRRIRRRRLKTEIILILVILFFISASWMMPPAKPTPGKWDHPRASELASARKYYELNGYNGDSITYLARWPQYSAYIRGETDNPDTGEVNQYDTAS